MNTALKSLVHAACALLLAVILANCGGGSSHPLISVSLNGSQGAIDEGMQVSLTATVANDSSNSGVTFGPAQPKVAGSCSGTGTSAGQCGTVSQTSPTTATYTAPMSAVNVVITATSKADSTKSNTFAVTVNQPPTIAASLTANISQACPALVSGGTPPYTLTANLPAWVTFNTTNGAICAGNVPSNATSSSFTITKLTDNGGYTSSSQIYASITVPIVIATNAPLPTGEVSQAGYTSGALTAAGGSGTYTAWTVVAGSLPSGLTISGTTTGTISGTPTAACSPCTFTVQAKDSLGATGTKQFTLTIDPRVAVTEGGALPSGTLGIAYNTTLTAHNGVSPYNGWTVSSGTLPSGLSLNAGTGAISGIPGSGSGGTASFSVTVKDSLNVTCTPANLSITINFAALAITTTSLPKATVGTAYDETIQTSGGDGTAIAFAVVSGTLPAWASLDTSTGEIRGTPSASDVGTSTPFEISATQSGTTVTSPSFTITVVATSACASGGAGASLLSGNYAFSAFGFNSTGFVTAAGRFHADGVNTASGGLIEFNSTTPGISTDGTPTSFTGCFVVNADHTGTMTIVNANAGLNTTLAIAVQANGNGRFITSDTVSPRLSGRFESQHATSFSNATISGDYAFGLQGFTTGSPGNVGAAGRFHANGSGGVSGGIMDIATPAGVATAFGGANFTSASYTVTDAANGRATLTFAVPDAYGTLNVHLACYLANVNSGISNSLQCIDTDTGAATVPVLSGQILTQNTPSGGFNNTNIVPPSNASVGYGIGIDSSGTPRIALSQVTFNTSTTPVTATFTQDLNKGGSVTFQTVVEDLAIASNGRIEATAGGTLLGIAYWIAPGEAFSVDTANNASVSFTQPQEAAPTGGFTNANFDGEFVIGTVNPIQSAVDDLSGVLTSTGSQGTLNGSGSVNRASGTAPQTFAATFNIQTSQDAAIGRVTVSMTSPKADTLILYIIDSKTAVAMPYLSTDTEPAVIYFNQ